MKRRIQAMWWTAALLVAAGIILSLSSTVFGQARASAWLSRQYEGGDGETYQWIMETNTLVFVVFGSILFGAGILLALASMGLHIFTGKPQEAKLDDSVTEAEVH